jgi:23S rRNA pseudouridine1911/1915/1917 synthase
MQHLKAPIVGDQVYGLRGIIPHRSISPALREVLADFKRQALHAIRLGLIHPATHEPKEWQIELPADMKLLLEAMRSEGPAESTEPDFDDSGYESLDEENEEDYAEELLEDEDVE